ncbi:4365_t:CDS:2, partial [Entrophospora sp. SA101]
SRVDPVDNDDDKDESPLVINFSEVLDEDPSFGSDINNIKLNDGEKMLDAIKGIEKIEDAIDFVTNFSSMIVEHQKRRSAEDRRKEKKDTTKICVLMHDQLTKLSKELEKSDKGNLIKEVNVYGVITS